MNLSAVKLVAADMDGTLLNSKHELNTAFYAIFEKMKSKGILFCAASGRQYYNILKQFQYFTEDIIFIAENGSYVVFEGKELLVTAMQPELTMELLLDAKAIENVNVILCGRKTAYIENNSPEFIDKLSLYYERVEIVDDLLKVENDDFLKIAICDLKGSEQNSYPYFKRRENDIQVKISGKIWLDLSDKFANKGRALKFVQDKFGVTTDETMAFGDFLNDIEMLQEAALSFAMANAHEKVKRVARYHAGSNDENGVIAVLKELIKQH